MEIIHHIDNPLTVLMDYNSLSEPESYQSETNAQTMVHNWISCSNKRTHILKQRHDSFEFITVRYQNYYCHCR